MVSQIVTTDLDRTRTKIREDLEIASALMIYALRKNINAFRFAGLRVPRIIQVWEEGMELPELGDMATEVAIFQEHLYERIGALANNDKMMRRIWRINEKTRRFREEELKDPVAARDTLNLIAKLINGLFARDADVCSELLLEGLERWKRSGDRTFTRRILLARHVA